MINTRYGLFETNSSSTHSVVILSKSQYEKWKRSVGTEDELAIYLADGIVKPEDVEFIKLNEYYTADELNVIGKTISDGYMRYEDVRNLTKLDDYVIFSENVY